MRKHEIKVGGLYTARVSGRFVTVRVDAIREVERSRMNSYTGRTEGRDTTIYDVTNLTTGRKTTFRSAAKFRNDVRAEADKRAAQVVQTPASAMVYCNDADGGCKKAKGHIGVCEGKGPPPAPILPDGMMCEGRHVFHVGATKPFKCPDCYEEETQELARAAMLRDKEGEQGPDPTPTTTGPVGPTSETTATAPTTAGAVPFSNGLAAKITAARVTRETGSPVAGMTPNAEQEAILAAAAEPGLRVLVVGAGAGTGKTATLKMLEQVLPGRGQYTAFNSSLVAESKAKFTKAACNTTHSLAFRAVGRLYQHRLGGERMKSYQVARILGIEAQTVSLKGMGQPDAEGRATDKQKVLQADFLAGQVLAAVKRFCQSADRMFGDEHIHHIDGIDATTADGKRGYDNNDRVRDYLLPFCYKAWADLTNVGGQLPFAHDVYVKIWSLGKDNDRPVIAADYILLDEAQDTAPVFLSILQQQTHAMLVFVGDSNQAIYEWRGAVDAMKAYPDATRRLLSQSYRFGQAVADVANAVLGELEEPTDLVMRGMPTIPSRVAEVDEPRCYLYRTNAGAVARVMQAMKTSKRVHLIGGGDDVVRWMEAAVSLQTGRGTRHSELCCFETWKEVVEYSETDEGGDLRLMCKLVKEFGAQRIGDALRNMPAEKDADIVVSTAHKSKGREWDTVKLGPDFPTKNVMTDADRRLLYVAATRAKLTLDITDCPPFCGGYEKGNGCGEGGEKRWIPGITINYTAPMPTAEDQAAWLPAKPEAAETTTPVAQPAAPYNRNEVNGNTWTKGRNGGWVVRGKPGQTGRVEVTKKSGVKSQETIKRVLWQDENVALYEV